MTMKSTSAVALRPPTGRGAGRSEGLLGPPALPPHGATDRFGTITLLGGAGTTRGDCRCRSRSWSVAICPRRTLGACGVRGRTGRQHCDLAVRAKTRRRRTAGPGRSRPRPSEAALRALGADHARYIAMPAPREGPRPATSGGSGNGMTGRPSGRGVRSRAGRPSDDGRQPLRRVARRVIGLNRSPRPVRTARAANVRDCERARHGRHLRTNEARHHGPCPFRALNARLFVEH
jgi:hypothetical protein